MLSCRAGRTLFTNQTAIRRVPSIACMTATSELRQHFSLWSASCRHLTATTTTSYIATKSVLLRKTESRWNPSMTTTSNIQVIGRRHESTQVLRPYVDPKLSYAYGRSSEHLIYSTIARELDRRVGEAPDVLAYISHAEGIQVTLGQFNEHVNQLAKAMVTKFNLTKGDFVGLFAYNCYNWLLVQFACSRIGAVLTPINPSYKPHELAYVLKKGKVKCLFVPGPKSIQSRELNNHYEVLQSNEVCDLFVEQTKEKPFLNTICLLDGENEYSNEELNDFKLAKYCHLSDWTRSIRSTNPQVFKSASDAEEAGVQLSDAFILSPELVSPDDLFAVYYTSGTTGKPKGACCSQFTVLNNTRFCQIRLRHGKPRSWRVVAATTLPLFHIFAGVLNALGPITANSAIVYTSYKYDIKAYVEAIYKYGANTTTLTPTILIDLLTYVEQHKLHDLPLKIIQPGGASLPPELVARAHKLLPQLEQLRTGYGSTENGAVATFQSIHEPAATRAHSVGPPVDFSEIRIVKPNSSGMDAAILPLGERGEIQTRGFNTMLEYLDEPKKTAESITPNRWYKTGDIGFMHPHGSIEICGRLKHMIIKGGENIYPEEVEQIMHKLDCIEKVHVVGVPDERFGEQVCAWVKLKEAYSESSESNYEQLLKKRNTSSSSSYEIHKQDIIDFCKTNMTYFKVPKYLLFVDDFPMTPTKKVQNHVMIEKSIEILNLKKNK